MFYNVDSSFLIKWNANLEKKCRVAVRFACVTIYVNKGGNKKTIQTIHKTLHKPYISLIFRALRNV